MNITCEACRERWDELFDDSPQGASSSETTQISEARAHLAQCAQCRSEFTLLKAARQELHAFPALVAPPDLRASIRQQLEAEAVSTTSAAAPEPVMTVEEEAQHKAHIENKILGGAWRETPVQRLKNLWLRFQKSLRHPATMALSSGAALLLICFVSLNTFQTAQAPPEPDSQVASIESENRDETQSEERKNAGQAREPLTTQTRKATPAAPEAAASRLPTGNKKNHSTATNPTIAEGAEAGAPAFRSNTPAPGKAAPPVAKPHPQVEKASPSPLPATPAPVKALPATPRDENAGTAAAKAQPAPLPAAGAPVTSQSVPPQTASPPAAMMARESQDVVVVGAAQSDNARPDGRAGAPQAAMAQRAPELRAAPEKSSPPKRYLARRRGAPERIEASITAPRHIGNAEVVVELPEEAQFTDGSRSRVLWRGTVRKDESIAVKFEAEVEPEAEDARVVLKETKDGATETVAYKDVPVSDTGRRRSR